MSSADTAVHEAKGVRTEIGPSSVSLDWEFWDPQLDALTDLNSGEFDVVVFRAGYGSGKTILGSRWSQEVAISIPKSHNLVLAPDATKGAPSTFKTFFEELPGEDTVPDEGGDPENSPLVENYHSVKRRLTWFNGAVTRLGSADVWNRFAGTEFHSIWGDEVAHYGHTDLFKLNEMLTSRQRTEEGPNVMLWTSTGNGYNDFYQFTEKQETPGGEALPSRISVIVADSRNNPFLPEKEKLVRQFEGTGREDEALAGGFASAEGLVYSRFSREHHVLVERPDLVDDWRLYGYDAGWNDPRVVVEIGKTHMGQFVVVDCFYESSSQVEDVIDPEDGTGWLAGRTKGELMSEHEPAHIEKFRQAGWPATKANKSLDEGIPYVRGLLKLDDEGRPGLLVLDDCVEVIQEFLSYKEDHVGKNGAPDHAMDALRYALFTHDNPSGHSGTGTWGN